MTYILDLREVTLEHLPDVGGKNASLGEMINRLSPLGIKVPGGFATTAFAYYDFLEKNNLDKKISKALFQLDINNMTQLKKASVDIRRWIDNAELPDELVSEIKRAYRQLQLKPSQSVAVRSSATAEDLPQASFAGQQETYLNIRGEKDLLTAIKKVFSSLFTERAISYRIHNGFDHTQVAISAGIQKMVRSDLAASGVMFTLDTESGFDQVIFITAAYGLGETIVQGLNNPDEFYVHKPTLREEKKSIISRKLGSKSIKTVYAKKSKKNKTATVNQSVPIADQQRFCISDDDILVLANQALLIESHYGKPMDIEWAKDGIDNEIYILQARPETVQSNETHRVLEHYCLEEKGHILTQGRSIGQKITHGVARLIKSPKQKDRLKPGEILVTDMTDPDWEPIMKRAAAIITNRGGRTCHAAIIAREMGIPAVVGCSNATRVIKDGQKITVSCAEGETGYVYKGNAKYRIDKTSIDQLPALPVELCMNLANPEQAFVYQFIPNGGVGLARLEFIINNMIGIHPRALLDYKKLPPPLKNKIAKIISAYKNPIEFYIEKLAEGIATIAAAFYPKPIIVRFSDFKSNEYANLIGGAIYEAHEENPMLGYRGASRYTSGNFRDCFTLECEAVRRVREEKGLINTHIMFPFVRTVNEATQLLTLTEKHGLKRGNGLKFYMMCEIPSNVILAEEFLEYFDGFSIGSNDLTQLALGLDRDSELIAHLFDERNSAVKALLSQTIQTCKRLNKYVGICGQGPSDHIDFAQWLLEQGINSMSLSPDSILKTWLTLSKTDTSNNKNLINGHLPEKSKKQSGVDPKSFTQGLDMT